MKKLTKIPFALARESTGAGAEILPLRPRARRALICVWRRDPASGRLICSWVEPTGAVRGAERNCDPPPALLRAA
jgi:hypothetical protein